ncbi:MAG: PD-(D/E)XK nuclease family protein [Barnesiella sp.]|nr:PD-(D/E)XK nuclease family protein [Barnesiella sp.]
MPEIDNIRFDEAVAMIEAFNNDHGCNMLQSKYKQQSLFEITKTARKERVHSAFLAWLFKENFENIPLNGLLYILYTNHTKQLRADTHQNQISYSSEIFKDQHNIIEHLRNQAIIQNTTYSISDVDTEYPISSISNKKGKKSNQFIDILLKCTSPKEEPLMILIENKIYANETQIEIDNEYLSDIISIGGNPSITKSGKKKCGQTLAYYNHFSKQHPNTNVLYVFLDPSSSLEMELATDLPKCECKGFIHITYQDLMDRILIPLRDNKNINHRIKSIISDYIACLGATLLEIEDNKSKDSLKAMAIDKETRELLQDFWAEHETLIMAALDSLTDDINTEEDTRNKIKNAVAALRSYNHDKYQFTYKSRIYDNNRKGYKKGELLYELIKVLNPTPLSSIVPQFTTILDHNKKSGVIDATDYNSLVIRAPSYTGNRFIPLPDTNPQIYISKQWGIDEIPQVINWASTQGIEVTTI